MNNHNRSFSWQAVALSLALVLLRVPVADGTYGLSDVSGQRIPQQRLVAVPEATCTLSEEKRNEERRQT
jgi:RNA polymerase-binding transcription factor DksA